MGLGFSKAFAIVIVIAIILSLGLRTPWIGLQIIMGYAVVKIFWNLLTKKKRWKWQLIGKNTWEIICESIIKNPRGLYTWKNISKNQR